MIEFRYLSINNCLRITKKRIFFSTLLWFVFTVLSAQNKSLKFTHFGKQDGLNQSSVNYIFQDSDDYVWVANFGGINRFDGYNFKSYVNDFDDATSISDNSVWVIYEKKDRSLWFGTKAGLSMYNTDTDDFTNFYINKYESSSTLAVKALFEDSSGSFYVGSEGEGLFEFSKNTNIFKRVVGIPSDAKVTSIDEDVDGNLWVGTENKGLFKLSKNRKVVRSFLTDESLSSSVIWSLYADSSNNVWIGSDSDGLIKYNSATNTFEKLKNKRASNNYNSGNKIKTIIADANSGLWIGSATNGLSHYSFESDMFYTYVVDPYDANSLHDSDVSSIFSGSQNVLYVGFYTKGFDKIIATPFSVIKNNPDDENSLSNNNVYSMYADKRGMLWFGSFGGGLDRYNPKTKQFKHYKHNENNSNSISHDWIRIIFEDSKGVMWIGTWGGGLNKLNRTTGKITRYLPNPNSKNSISHNIITAIFEDSSGKLWIGSYGGGINIYRPETDDFTSIIHNKNDFASLSDDHITSFYEEDGLIWVCTYGGGLNAYDKITNKFRRYLPNKDHQFSLNNHKTLHIYKEKDSSFFWITTLGGGLNKFYYKENKFVHYTEKDGLANNSTMGMLKDNQNNYWISSNSGLSYFNPSNKSFVNYTTKDGLVSDDHNLEAYMKSKDGLFYFGGKNGVTYFNPNDVKLGSDFPKIKFTNIKVEDSTYLNTTKKLKIKYKNRLVVDFAAINANISENIKYSYQLSGEDETWRNIDGIRHLEFTSLSPGDYKLRLKSTNANKIWNTDYTELDIYIKPPWYMNWYFRIAAILALVLGSITYYRYQINSAKEQNRLLELKVKERTKTIEESKIVLEKQSKVISKQNDELQDLNQLKDRILSILSHDIKTPLNSLNTIVSVFDIDELIEDKASLEEYMGVVQNELGKVRSLLDNILLWAKYQITNVEINKETVSVYSITDEIHQLYEEKAKEKQLSLINTLDQKHQIIGSFR